MDELYPTERSLNRFFISVTWSMVGAGAWVQCVKRGGDGWCARGVPLCPNRNVLLTWKCGSGVLGCDDDANCCLFVAALDNREGIEKVIFAVDSKRDLGFVSVQQARRIVRVEAQVRVIIKHWHQQCVERVYREQNALVSIHHRFLFLFISRRSLPIRALTSLSLPLILPFISILLSILQLSTSSTCTRIFRVERVVLADVSLALFTCTGSRRVALCHLTPTQSGKSSLIGIRQVGGRAGSGWAGGRAGSGYAERGGPFGWRVDCHGEALYLEASSFLQ